MKAKYGAKQAQLKKAIQLLEDELKTEQRETNYYKELSKR